MKSAHDRNWHRPKLRVLARVRTEERILQLCKQLPSGTGPSSKYNACLQARYCEHQCQTHGRT